MVSLSGARSIYPTVFAKLFAGRGTDGDVSEISEYPWHAADLTCPPPQQLTRPAIRQIRCGARRNQCIYELILPIFVGVDSRRAASGNSSAPDHADILHDT